MLIDSVPSSSLANPLPLAEDSVDLEIMFSIMTGRAQEVLGRPSNWKQAARLYRLVDKYQMDLLRPWFAQMCCAHATEEPWEALFLACNQSPMETHIIKTAITEGFEKHDAGELYNESYFKTFRTTTDGVHCWSTIRASNTTFLFGLKLGIRGFLAYTATFDRIRSVVDGDDDGMYSWNELGDHFVQNAIAVQQANETGTSRQLSHCRSLDATLKSSSVEGD